MRDIHCHILPDVDDGARSISESLQMLEAAKRSGITAITCTPHCRDPWFDYERMMKAFFKLEEKAKTISSGPELSMGFEVNYKKLAELGSEWIDRLACKTGVFLLELPTTFLPSDWERMVFEIQAKGYLVTIAHPERYKAVQESLDVVRRFIRAGCKIQISADFYLQNKRHPSYKTAKKLFESDLVHYVASDAHRPDAYRAFMEVKNAYMTLGAHGHLT